MKLKIKLLFVSMLIFAAGVQVMKAQNTQQAMTYLDAEQFTKAQDILEKQLVAAPTADNQFALGYFFVRRGNLDQAKATFDKGLTIDPKNQLNNIGNAMVLMGNKKYPQAKVIIDAALAATKMKNADVLYRAAEAYTLNEHTNDPAEAIRLIEMIVEKTKKTAAEYQIVKGDAYLLKNDGGPAVSAYEQALSIDSKNSKALTNIGKVFKRGKNVKEAQIRYTNAIQADSNYAPAYREYGELWLNNGKYKNAAFYYDKYLQKAEPTCETKLRYVKLAFLAKNYEGARRVQKEVEICSANNAALKNDLDIPRMKGYMLYDEGKYPESIGFLTDLLKKLPTEKVLLSDKSILAKSHQKAGNDSLAMLLFKEVAPVDTTENFYLNMHDILYKAKKYTNASEASLSVINWRNERKEKIASNDYLNLIKDYYFGATSIIFTPTATKEDTLRKVDLAQKTDAVAVKLIELNPGYIPSHLWRARANSIIDLDKTKGLAIPHYEKFIELTVDKEKSKRDILEAYRYLGLHNLVYAPVKDEVKGDGYFNKVKEIDPNDATMLRYYEAKAALVAPVVKAPTTTKAPVKPNAPAPTPVPKGKK
jgi:tetratricopeptide (TPR) repeat protein